MINPNGNGNSMVKPIWIPDRTEKPTMTVRIITITSFIFGSMFESN